MVNYQFLQNQKPNYQRRRLKWVVYDEYDELASAERIIIEPQTGLNQDLVGSIGSNSPNVPQDEIAKSSSIEKDSDINAQDEESSKSVSRKKNPEFSEFQQISDSIKFDFSCTLIIHGLLMIKISLPNPNDF